MRSPEAEPVPPAGSLRVLVACAECRRQVDATGAAAGSLVRCDCGAVLEVPKTRPHDAAVVRCSACGGPRAGRETACGHCGADFTVHERDLDTICPGCVSRISRKARFCHSCGQGIHPQGRAGELTRKACPACGVDRLLAARQLGGRGLPALECRACAGLWLGLEVVDLLERQARIREKPGPVQTPPATDGGKRAASGEAIYRRCPECGTVMHRRNYGRKSGVLVDVCTMHGIWFDAGELDTLLEWIERGGLRRAREMQIEEQAHELRAERLKRMEPDPAENAKRSSPWDFFL